MTFTWRRLCRTFAVLVALLVLAPTIDAFVCIDDAHASTAMASVSSPDLDHGQSGHDDSVPGVCHHGHCHLAAPFVMPDASDRLLTKAATDARLAWLSEIDRAPAPVNGLERPPRA